MRKSPELFFSHRIGSLVDCLVSELQNHSVSPLQNQIVLVPNALLKQWLLLEIAKRKGIATGLKILTPQEGIFPDRSPSLNAIELFCLIYQSLSDCSDPSLLAYLEGKKRRLHDLSEQLASLFISYGQFGENLFDPQCKPIDWQHAILQKLFVEGPWRTPVQMVSDEPVIGAPIHCFGIDFLPPLFWKALFRFSPLSIYLFSPCVDFWGDLCSDRERRNLNRYWKKRGASAAKRNELDAYLREAPPLLANWGKIGRETLKILDRFDCQISECYPLFEGKLSLLNKVQSELLYFEKPPESRVLDPNDNSIQIALTGSSRLREVEVLRDGILKLVSESKLGLNEISVLAPDIEPYVPLIEWVFSDRETPIPYRILGLDIGSRSSFSQGLSRLFALASGRWETEEVLILFETPSFYRKQGWDGEKLERFRDWFKLAHIQWGIDSSHRQKILEETLGGDTASYLDSGSWEKGLDRLLDGLVYLFPEGSPFQNRQINADELEEFLALLLGLKEKLSSMIGEKELGVWADSLESLAQEYLAADFTDDADSSAQNSFRQLIKDLKQAQLRVGNRPFPFALIQRLLIRPCPGQIHSSSLHAVRFATIEEAALIPAKALFLIGMDEESFPRLKTASSLDLLKRERIAVPDVSDLDRYLFLQTLFSAQDFLRISYRHLSPEEGKEVNPSLMVQELLSYLGPDSASLTVTHPSLSFDARCFSEERFRTYSKIDFRTARAFYGAKRELSSWPKLDTGLKGPEGEIDIPISSLSLLARNPWKFYLQKIRGVFLNETWENSFALQKNQLLRASLGKPIEKILSLAQQTLPPGLFGEAFRLELLDQASEWSEKLIAWGVEKPFSLIFREGCSAKQWQKENQLELPSIELEWGNRLKVKLVGEIKNATPKGLISISEDNIGGALKIWPEALIAAIALDAPQILLIKNGKMKSLDSLADLKAHLKQFIEYYFLCQHSISPLLPEWGDALLRKGTEELEKKRETTLSGRGLFEDPVIDWIAARTEVPSAERIVQEWQAYLRDVFAGLIGLYPARIEKGDHHATV